MLWLLEGIFNWINNCPIPISQPDPFAQTDQEVSSKEEREWQWDGDMIKET